jgi:7-cyano-7-deazaguanine synthase
MKAIAVTSGGMDSITNGLMALKKGYQVTYLHFNYRQKSELGEKRAVENVVSKLNEMGYPLVSEIQIDLPFYSGFKGSSLLDKEEPIPLGYDSVSQIGTLWVPARNVVFLAIASAYAEQMDIDTILLGCNQSEIGYPDNTLEFLKRFEYMLEYGALKKIKVTSFIWEYDKPHILKWGIDNGFAEIYRYTWSCDNAPSPEGLTCGECGCCCNRRLSFYILNKLYGPVYEDLQHYANEDYFFEVFLPKIKVEMKERFWFYKYKDLL